MTIAEVIAAYGAYYLNNGQNAASLYQRLFRRGVTEQLFTSVPTDNTIWQASKTSVGTILQPFQKAWTPKGSLTATPITIPQFKMKADLEETPDELEDTWLGFLADGNLKRTEWPFVRWLIEVHLVPQIEEDFELNEIFGGVRVEPTAGTPGAPGTSINGIKKVLNDHAGAGRITPIALGAFPSTSDTEACCEYVEAFAKSIVKRYRNTPMYISMSEDNALAYAKGRGKKYGKDTNMVNRTNDAPVADMLLETSVPVEYHRQRVVGLPSVGDSGKVWATPVSNAKRLIKKSQNIGQFQIENVDRKVKLYTDFYKGIGFVLPEAVFMNDVDMA